MQFMKPEYAVQIIWSPEDKAYLAIPYELPGCIADGKTPEEAIANLRVIIDEWIEVAREQGRPIPKPMTAADFERAQQQEQARLRQFIENEVNVAVQKVIEQMASATVQHHGFYRFSTALFPRPELEPADSVER